MPGFLYHAPISTAPDLAKCRELGLGYAFSANPTPREVQRHTPSGKNGYVFADGKRVERVACELEQQVWRKIPGKDVWVGYWKDAKPGPVDLARAEQLAGFNITMADGNEWLIPVVRSFDTECGKATPLLPTLYDLDDDGQLTTGKVQDAHKWLWDLTEPAWQAMVTDAEVTNQSLLSTACKLLGANYVVDVMELAGLLQIFSPQLSPAGVVSLAIDARTFAAWSAAKKKTESQPETDAGSSTWDGETEDAPTTRQPALTS